MAIEFRKATTRDAEVISALWCRASEARLGEPKTHRDVFVAFILERMQLEDALFILAEDAGRVVGIGHGLTAREHDGDGAKIPGVVHISMVAVEPSRWGAGIGTSVVAYLIDRWTERGFRAAQLWTASSNERARTLYERLGFAPAGREKLDDHGERIVLYRKKLAAG